VFTTMSKHHAQKAADRRKRIKKQIHENKLRKQAEQVERERKMRNRANEMVHHQVAAHTEALRLKYPELFINTDGQQVDDITITALDPVDHFADKTPSEIIADMEAFYLSAGLVRGEDGRMKSLTNEEWEMLIKAPGFTHGMAEAVLREQMANSMLDTLSHTPTFNPALSDDERRKMLDHAFLTPYEQAAQDRDGIIPSDVEIDFGD
jgi:hypothetical protein